MKIFLGEKVIELIDKQPLTVGPGTTIHEYTSGKRLADAIWAFERNKKQSALLIWPSKENIKLKKKVFHLFRRIDAAGGKVLNEKGEILFIFRMGKWDLPKGKLNPNETREQAAIREVCEETGLEKLVITKPLPPTYHIYLRKGKQILKKTYWFEMQAPGNQNLHPQAEENITDISWISWNNLPLVLDHTYPSIIELMQNQ